MLFVIPQKISFIYIYVCIFTEVVPVVGTEMQG